MAVHVFSSPSIINLSDKVFHVALPLLCNPSYQPTYCALCGSQDSPTMHCSTQVLLQMMWGDCMCVEDRGVA